MNYFCFVCQCAVSELEQLFVHLKTVHSLKSNSIYQCCFLNCKQQFSAFRSFSKHMKTERQNTNDSEVPMNYNSFDKINVSEYDKSIDKQSAVQLNLLRYSALKFSLRYYSKVNFSRKEASELQKDS